MKSEYFNFMFVLYCSLVYYLFLLYGDYMGGYIVFGDYKRFVLLC